MANDTTAQFIEFLLGQDVLKFGEFTLKSGRISPYFFNLGQVAQGDAYATLGAAYADAIIASDLEFDVLFGPAYKGIPIAVATAIVLAAKCRAVGVAYNRKEAKDHGEGGMLVGAPVTGRVLLIDDVLTSGKAIREAVALIQDTDAQIAGAVIAMDRQELMDIEDRTIERTAVVALAEELAVPVISIATMENLIQYLEGADKNIGENDAILARMRDYQTQYCVAAHS